MRVRNVCFAFSVALAVASSQQLLVIDTDPGVDDVLAIMTSLGDQNFQVLAITCVRGNTNMDNVVDNVLRILSVSNRYDVPVFAGLNNSLLGLTPDSDAYFGHDGLGDFNFSKPFFRAPVQRELAGSFLARIVMERPKQVTILALGPLTNLALAIIINPDFLRQAQQVVILGGTVRGQGNVAPGMEFNFYMDPDAAALVLNKALATNVLLTLIPMETVVENDLNKQWRMNVLSKIPTKAVTFLNILEKRQFQKNPSENYHPYDVYATAVVLSPTCVCRERQVYGFVEHRGFATNGVLLVDYINITKNAANLDIIEELDMSIMRRIIYMNLSKLY